METEAVKESVLRGHRVYKAVWTPLIGEELPVCQGTSTSCWRDRRSRTQRDLRRSLHDM